MSDAIHKQFAIQQLKGSAVTSAFAADRDREREREDYVLEYIAPIGTQKLQPYTCFGSVCVCVRCSFSHTTLAYEAFSTR